MAKLSYKRKPCQGTFTTISGPMPCGKGALRGSDYCRSHRAAWAAWKANLIKELGDTLVARWPKREEYEIHKGSTAKKQP